MFKKILIGLSIIIAILIAGYFYLINSGIQLPEETDAIIEEVLEAGELPELIKGETGFAENGGVKIWYEKIVPQDSIHGTILLIMGHSSSAMIWGPEFTNPLVDAGYQVIRYDNRGVGESDWMTNWDAANPYTLEDMAKDGIAVLDAAGVDKAHIAGASMGGMIAQRVALSHSERVLSLTSIMSSGYMNDPEMPALNTTKMLDFLRLSLRYLMPPSEAGGIKFMVGIQQLFQGKGPYRHPIKKSAETTLYELRKRKGRNANVGDQHTAAIGASGSRLEELGNIKMPTLIIHGKSDPLVRFEHCEKYAPLIPHAKKLFIDGMGHDMPTIYMEQYHTAILDIIGSNTAL
ncbi:MAG: alpha/beta fold hydrolase [Saprospiraceae bacterium]